MPLHFVDDLADSRLDVYRSLKKTNLTRWSGQFIAEGKKLVAQLLDSEFPVDSVLTSEKFIDLLEPYFAGRRADVPVFALPHAQAQMLVGMKFHAGMLACGRRLPMPPATELINSERRHLLLVCAGTENPDNVGAIIRNAAAFGATAVLLGAGSSDPFSRRALRVSMGAALRIPVIEVGPELRSVLDGLRQQHAVEMFATVLADDAEPLRNVQFSGHVAVLLGNEDAGLAPEWIEYCDRRITIPMSGNTDSLNVAVSAGVFLHHFAPDAT